MNRCVKCILPDSVPGVSFDENGVCSVCRDHLPESLLGDDAFAELLAQSERGASEYDCIVPLSGGRDSAYVLYLAKAVYGLKPLAVNYDNEFRNPQAVSNIEQSCSALGVDLRVVRSKQDVCTNIVRANTKAAIPLGLPYMMGSFCRQCSYGYRSAVFIEAEKRGIPLILWGSSAAESTQNVMEKATIGMQQSKWKKLKDLDFYRTEYYCFKQRREFPVTGGSAFGRDNPKLKNPLIREIKVFDYLPWERHAIKTTIERELGWAKPPGLASTWRIDCLLHGVVNFFFAKTFGCTKDCMGYCNMINAGQMTREEALAQEEQWLQTPWEKVEKFLEEQIKMPKRDIARLKVLQAASPFPSD